MAPDRPQALGQDRTAGSRGSGQKQGQERLPRGDGASFQEAAASRLSSSLLPVCASGSHSTLLQFCSLSRHGWKLLLPGAGGSGGQESGARPPWPPGSVTDPTPPHSLFVDAPLLYLIGILEKCVFYEFTLFSGRRFLLFALEIC